MISYDEKFPTVKDLCKEVLFSETEIDKRLLELANKVYKHYTSRKIYHLHTITVLNGASNIAIELMYLIQKINEKSPDKPPLIIHADSVKISSYKKGYRSNCDPKYLSQPQFPTKNHYVLIIEDIVDTGLTMKYLIHDLRFKSKKPKDIKLFTLLDKPEGRIELCKKIKPDFKCFSLVGKPFVVGRGLDFKHYYRNLKNIIVVKDKYYK